MQGIGHVAELNDSRTTERLNTDETMRAFRELWNECSQTHVTPSYALAESSENVAFLYHLEDLNGQQERTFFYYYKKTIVPLIL